ncbi:MAG: hypothetical protein AAF004_02700 [Pseudomonadota bacterium]
MTTAIMGLTLFLIPVLMILLVAFLGDRTGYGLDLVTRKWREVRVSANVTFLTEEQGGSKQPAWNSRSYRTHLVVGDPEQREVKTPEDGSAPNGLHLPVCFDGDGEEMAQGVVHKVWLVLANSRAVEYKRLVPGATFTLRGSGRIVGHGKIL